MPLRLRYRDRHSPGTPPWHAAHSYYIYIYYGGRHISAHYLRDRGFRMLSAFASLRRAGTRAARGGRLSLPRRLMMLLPPQRLFSSLTTSLLMFCIHTTQAAALHLKLHTSYSRHFLRWFRFRFHVFLFSSICLPHRYMLISFSLLWLIFRSLYCYRSDVSIFFSVYRAAARFALFTSFFFSRFFSRFSSLSFHRFDAFASELLDAFSCIPFTVFDIAWYYSASNFKIAALYARLPSPHSPILCFLFHSVISVIFHATFRCWPVFSDAYDDHWLQLFAFTIHRVCFSRYILIMRIIFAFHRASSIFSDC